MTGIHQWAARWRISPEAVAELTAMLGASVPHPTAVLSSATSEAATQSHRILRAARRGGILWRNNSGACTDSTGRLIRYGLGNISQQVNKVMKSSDLIGITPLVITPDMVGYTVGVFTAEECKAPNWRFRVSDERAVAQFNFIKKVLSLGGMARFVTDPETP